MFNLITKYLRPALFVTCSTAFGLSTHSTPTTNFLAQCLSTSTKAHPDDEIYDCLVIGGGVVGLAVGRELSVRGHTTLLLEKTANICTGASAGNSGIGCTGYDAPEGSLERWLLRRSILRHPNLYRSLGLSYNHVNKCGALVVAWNSSEAYALNEVLHSNHAAGDTEATLLHREDILDIEPALAQSSANGAVWVPREMVTEPWLVPIAYANNMLLNGGKIKVGSEVCRADLKELNDDQKVWHVTLTNGTVVRARTVFNCAGLYGDLIDRLGVGRSTFSIKPRKGQFVVFSPIENEHQSPNVIIQPVPTLRTKGVIVWKSVYGNIVVGPTAEEQEDRDDTSNDAQTIATLKKYGESILPALKSCRVVGTYSGIRPATEHRDYQIHHTKEQQWVTVGGIRSTGLTCASGISEYVADLYEGAPATHTNNPHQSRAAMPRTDPVLPPYLPSLPLQHPTAIPNPAAPDLYTLASDYYGRNDGQVYCFGRLWKVTHPLSIHGMTALGPVKLPKRRSNETLREFKTRYEQWQRRKNSDERNQATNGATATRRRRQKATQARAGGAQSGAPDGAPDGAQDGDQQPVQLPKKELKLFTAEELDTYDGRRLSKPILLAVYGDVFDVSYGGENGEPSMYGVGSGYHALAGKACTRALALMSVDPKEIARGDDLSGLKQEEIEAALSWHRFLVKKYKVVGRM